MMEVIPSSYVKGNLKTLREMQNIFSASELFSSCVENRTLRNTRNNVILKVLAHEMHTHIPLPFPYQ